MVLVAGVGPAGARCVQPLLWVAFLLLCPRSCWVIGWMLGLLLGSVKLQCCVQWQSRGVFYFYFVGMVCWGVLSLGCPLQSALVSPSALRRDGGEVLYPAW